MQLVSDDPPEVAEVGPSSALEPAGALDRAASGALRRGVAELVSRGSSPVVVDLSEVTSVDSDGMAALIGAAHVARSGRVRLVILDAPWFVHELLSPLCLQGLCELRRTEPRGGLLAARGCS
jgi:anti-anti-sigma factor